VETEVEVAEAKAAQQLQLLKGEMVKLQQQHDVLLQQKTNEIANLKDTIELIKSRTLDHSFTSEPSPASIPRGTEPLPAEPSGVEAELLNLAQQQASRDAEVFAHAQRVTELENELAEAKKLLELFQMQEKVLKEEIRNSERSKKREGLDIDYLKQVVVKYLETEDAALVNVMAKLLEFSPDEIAMAKSSKKKAGLSANLWGFLSPSK
jgi:hypothetical protein